MPPRDAPLRALSFMLLAASSFAGMNALARGLREVPWPMLAFARAALGLAAALAVARARGGSLAIRDRATMWQRSAFGSLSMLCTFYALTHMPLSDATALLNTTPLWITALARVRMGERTSWRVKLALALAFGGVVLVERPGLSVGDSAGLVALAASVLSALAMVSLRRLAAERVDAVVVHFSAVATAATLALSARALLHGAAPPALRAPMIAGVALMGASASLGQFAMTRAYSLDKAARVGAASFAQVLLAVLLDLAVFRRAPGAESAAGIALIVAGGAALVWDASREQTRLQGSPSPGGTPRGA